MLQPVYTETTGTRNNYNVYPCVWHGTGSNAMLLKQTSPQSLYITYFWYKKLHTVWLGDNSIAKIVTSYRLDSPVFKSQQGQEIYPLLHNAWSLDWFWGPTLSPIQQIPGALSPESKWPGHKADHFPLYSAQVISLLCYVPSWHRKRQLYSYF